MAARGMPGDSRCRPPSVEAAWQAALRHHALAAVRLAVYCLFDDGLHGFVNPKSSRLGSPSGPMRKKSVEQRGFSGSVSYANR
ncbi:hypothetical protein SV7mr_22790 [Stieleria bergensis]|uniref:Uncharacterized protein n=1 Tax=Stieleria bergensis TaxID=2528025 RepID=A0A517SUG8_9BACT|nr:hypothetical protein SV7mr_22790 [Planctomycetes bacterium SV_7m_r]